MPYVIKVCQLPTTGRQFPSGTPVSTANKTDRHEITKCGVETDVKPHQTNKRGTGINKCKTTVQKKVYQRLLRWYWYLQIENT